MVVIKLLITNLILSLVLYSCLSPKTSFVRSRTDFNAGKDLSSKSCQVFQSQDKFAIEVGNDEEVEGLLIEEITDNLSSNESKTAYLLEKSYNKEVIQMNPLSEEIRQKFSRYNGKIIRVKKSLSSPDSNSADKATIEDVSLMAQETPKIVATQDIKMLMIRIDFNNHKASQNFPLVQAQRYMEMLKSYFDELSFGQIKIDIDANKDGVPDIETATVNSNAICTNALGTLRNSIDNLISDNFKKSDYTHFAYIAAQASKQTFCPYNGVAYRGGANHQYIPDPFSDVVFVHETGHNLGLRHASFDVNGNGIIDSGANEVYGDHSGVMGNQFPVPPHFNTPNSVKLGILDEHPFHTLKIKSSGEYKLSPLSSNETAPFSKIITFENLSEEIMISQREIGQGLDSTLKSSFSGINIYLNKVFDNGSNFGQTGSLLLKTLQNVGESYTHTQTGVKVDLLARNNTSSEIRLTLPTDVATECNVKPFAFNLEDLKAIDENSFEVELSVTNQSTKCPAQSFKFNLESEDVSLAEQINGDFQLSDGEDEKIILKFNHKKPVASRGQKIDFTIRALDSLNDNILGVLSYRIEKDGCS